MSTITVNDQETATLLAALRSFQKCRDVYTEHFAGVDPLSNEAIDELCLRINVQTDWLGKVVRVNDGPGGARIYGTDSRALHAVLHIKGQLAYLGMVGSDNLSVVPIKALVLATREEMDEYSSDSADWDRKAFVSKIPA